MPSTTNPMQDPTSPYYVNPNENTSLPSISEKFNRESYGQWRRSMMLAFSVKNKLGFIN